jgi:hypothetical protein
MNVTTKYRCAKKTAIVGLTIVKMISLVEIIGIKDLFGKIQQSLAHVNYSYF